MKHTFITISGVIFHEEKILLLKRNANRTSQPNKWQVVTGYIEERESGENAIIREVKEETGLDVEIIQRFPVAEIEDEQGRWIVLGHFVKTENPEVILDLSEHSEFVWIHLHEIYNYDCADGLIEFLESTVLKQNL